MGRIRNWMRPIAVHSELDNFLIIVVIWDGYSAVVAVLCVVNRRWHTMLYRKDNSFGRVLLFQQCRE